MREHVGAERDVDRAQPPRELPEDPVVARLGRLARGRPEPRHGLVRAAAPLVEALAGQVVVREHEVGAALAVLCGAADRVAVRRALDHERTVRVRDELVEADRRGERRPPGPAPVRGRTAGELAGGLGRRVGEVARVRGGDERRNPDVLLAYAVGRAPGVVDDCVAERHAAVVDLRAGGDEPGDRVAEHDVRRPVRGGRDVGGAVQQRPERLITRPADDRVPVAGGPAPRRPGVGGERRVRDPARGPGGARGRGPHQLGEMRPRRRYRDLEEGVQKEDLVEVAQRCGVVRRREVARRAAGGAPDEPDELGAQLLGLGDVSVKHARQLARVEPGLQPEGVHGVEDDPRLRSREAPVLLAHRVP